MVESAAARESRSRSSKTYSLKLAWVGVAVWSMFFVSLRLHLLPDLGTSFNTVRTVVLSCGLLGLFLLSYSLGTNQIGIGEKISFVSVFICTEVVNLTSGFLIGVITESLLLVLAFVLGRRRIPYLTLTAIFLVASFLHLGKGQMREEFWDEGTNYSSDGQNPVDVMNFWVRSSWSRVAESESEPDEGTSFLERSDLLHFEIPVVALCPNVFPFLNGKTYLVAASVFVPRFVWPNKPMGNAPDMMLAVHFGIQTPESVNVTAVGLGGICEAWANFGWVGILVAGAGMGLLFRIPVMLSRGVKPNESRYLLCLPFAPFAMSLEHCFGSALHSLTLSMLVTGGGLWLYRSITERSGAVGPGVPVLPHPRKGASS